MESRKTTGTLRGFTLMEMMVAIGIFAIMSVAITATFSSGFGSYGDAREVQRNLEAAQFAMNTLAKQLRTSTIVSGSGSVAGLRFYEYSSGRCFEYRISGGVLQARWKSAPIVPPATLATECNASTNLGAWSSASNLTSGNISGQFFIVPSDGTTVPARVGRVTVSLIVKKDATSTFESRIQTSVSLRDYDVSGL